MNSNLAKKSLSIFMAFLMILAVPFGVFGASDTIGVQASAVETEEVEETITDVTLESVIDYVVDLVSSFMGKIFDILKTIAQIFGFDFDVTEQDFDITLEEMYYYSTEEYIFSFYENYNSVITYNLEDPYYDTFYIDSDYVIVTYDEMYNFTVMYDRVDGAYYYYEAGVYRTLAGDVVDTYNYLITDNYVMGISDYEYITSVETSDDKIVVVTQIDDKETIDAVATSYYYEAGDDIVSLKFEYELNSETYVIEEMVAYGVYEDGTEYMYNILEVTYDSIYTSGIHANIMEEFSSVTEYRTITVIISSGTEDELVFETEVADNYPVGIYLPDGCYVGIFTDPECTEAAVNDTTTGDVTVYSYFVS